MACVLSSLSGGEAGWILTSCLCRGDTGWGLIASPRSSALALLPGILIGICSEFTPNSHLFFMLQLSGGVGTWMPVSSRCDTRLTSCQCRGSLWASVGHTHPHLGRRRPSSMPHPLPRVSPSHLGVGRCSCSSAAHSWMSLGEWSLTGLSHFMFIVNHIAHPLLMFLDVKTKVLCE